MITPYIEPIIERLKKGDVVGLPTETVYGLAASIHTQAGIEKIFKIKQRPFFDPLIVHIAGFSQIAQLVSEWPRAARVLSESFWPGPLTLVVKKSESVSDLITSGLNSVALRWPSHPLAQEVIGGVGFPLAAPSANKFGKVSPTQASHVEDEFLTEKILILDGGPCEVGLESTVVSVTKGSDGDELVILRPGQISNKDIEELLRGKEVAFSWGEKDTSKITGPGQVQHHYMPKIPLVLMDEGLTDHSDINVFLTEKLRKPIRKFNVLNLPDNGTMAARELYSQMRLQSETGQPDCLVFHIKPVHKGPAWEAIMDRLHRAAMIHLEA